MRLIQDDELRPGEVRFNHLDEIDPSLPPEAQESLVAVEDVLSVWYANGVVLEVSFYRRMTPEAFFAVEVVPIVPGTEWTPAVRKECREWDALRTAVLKLASVARNWMR